MTKWENLLAEAREFASLKQRCPESSSSDSSNAIHISEWSFLNVANGPSGNRVIFMTVRREQTHPINRLEYEDVSGISSSSASADNPMLSRKFSHEHRYPLWSLIPASDTSAAVGKDGRIVKSQLTRLREHITQPFPRARVRDIFHKKMSGL